MIQHDEPTNREHHLEIIQQRLEEQFSGPVTCEKRPLGDVIFRARIGDPPCLYELTVTNEALIEDHDDGRILHAIDRAVGIFPKDGGRVLLSNDPVGDGLLATAIGD